jgi:hypothetical protein
VPALLASAGVDRAYTILTGSVYGRQGSWVSGFLAWLPDEAVTKERLDLLYAHYDKATVVDLFRDLDFLAKYERIDSRAVPSITQKLVNKATSDTRIGNVLTDLFDGRGPVASRLREVFGSSPADIALLKRAYLVAALGSVHLDYDASAFNVLLDLDPTFSIDWVDSVFAQSKSRGLVSSHDDHRDYSSLWLRDDFMAVMRSILVRIKHYQGTGFGSSSYDKVFMALRQDHPEAAVIRERQDQLLLAWIARSANEHEEMAFVFSLAESTSAERRRLFIAAFLEQNSRYEDFRTLPLEPTSWGWSGSAVPMLQQRVDFLESLLRLFDRVELLDHRRLVEDRIGYLRNDIEAEKKRGFLRR